MKWLVLFAALAAVLWSTLSRVPTQARAGSAASPAPPRSEAAYPAGGGSGAAPSAGARRIQAPELPASAELGAGAGATPRPVTSVLPNVTVVSHGRVVWRGTVDLRQTLAGIESGRIQPRDTFQNREGRLPPKPRGYYREFVHPTAGASDAGPQRVVQGKGGELFYSADHYQTFVPLN